MDPEMFFHVDSRNVRSVVLDKIVEEVEQEDEQYLITRDGKPIAVIISVEQYELLTEETA